MSIARGLTYTHEDNDPPILLPSGILNLSGGIQVDSAGLPDTFDRDKLANLFNIACRSISQLSKYHCINQCQNSFRYDFISFFFCFINV